MRKFQFTKNTLRTVGSTCVLCSFGLDNRRKLIEMNGFSNEKAVVWTVKCNMKTLSKVKTFCFNLLETKTDTYENVSPNTNCNGRGVWRTFGGITWL